MPTPAEKIRRTVEKYSIKALRLHCMQHRIDAHEADASHPEKVKAARAALIARYETCLKG